MKRRTVLRILALLPLPAALGLWLLARGRPEAVERLYSTGLYPRIAAPVSRFMALCPVPVVEIALILLVLFWLYSLVRRRFFRVLATFALIPAIFFGGWGLNYYRLPLEETLNLPVQPSTSEELLQLCTRLITEANESRTDPPDNPLALVPAALDAAAVSWPIPQQGFAAPKYALSSPLLTRFLIEGITSPFTLEGLVNRQIPAMSIPNAACHEAAHVRGFTREEDASLIAYLACRASEEPYFRYSGSVNALLYSLSALKKSNPDAYQTCRALLEDDVRRDLAEHAAFWEPYEQTEAAKVATEVNNAYLQTASGGEQSVQSYGRLVDLLLALQRKEETP